jgi:hypothetical protein
MLYKKQQSKPVREALSQLHLLINNDRIIKGTLVYLRNTCGKSNCKCAKGEKHISLYIKQNLKRETKITLIPKSRWQDVKQMVDNYKKAIQLLNTVSDFEWRHLKDKP